MRPRPSSELLRHPILPVWTWTSPKTRSPATRDTSCSTKSAAPARPSSAPPACSSSAPAASAAPLLLYLAAAGIGTIGLIDDDHVDLSNLQRQIAHTTDRVGVPKVRSAAAAAASHQPGRHHRAPRDPPHRRQRPRPHRPLRPRLRRQRQFRHPLPRRRRLRPGPAAPSSPPPSSASTASSPSSSRTPAAPATAAFTRPHPHPAWSPVAVKPASSVPSPASWARSRPPKR